jgi:cysteine desulfurase
MIYLDWAATAQPDLQALQAGLDITRSYFGNPSSLHKLGREAERVLNECRLSLSSYLDCWPEELYFTSGGTEANNLIINSILNNLGEKYTGQPKVITSGLEHDSIYKPALALAHWGAKVVVIKANPGNGRLDLSMLEQELDEQTRLVSLMFVNNETGVIQPVKEAVQLVKQFSQKAGRRILFHTDAVQALGKIPFSLKELDVDTAAFSAHKIGGPKGVGCLYIRKGLQLDPVYKGGEQEQGIRPGTENLPGIYAFSEAVQNSFDNHEHTLQSCSIIMKGFIEKLKMIPGLVFLPEERGSVPEAAHFSQFILKVAIPPIPGEVLVRVLEDKDIYVSTGSACSSRKKEKNHVLYNMGVPDKIAASSIRISLGPSTKEEELNALLKALKQEIPTLMKATKS